MLVKENQGNHGVIHTLDHEEYLKELDKKLNEEEAEYQEAKSLEEMADVLEVLYSICRARGYSVVELEEKRKTKKKERGGFTERVYLESVETR